MILSEHCIDEGSNFSQFEQIMKNGDLGLTFGKWSNFGTQRSIMMSKFQKFEIIWIKDHNGSNLFQKRQTLQIRKK